MKNYKRRFKNKSFDWYGLSQRFSIRKYHFGAASVLLGTALILGHSQGAVKAEETGKTLNGELVADNPEKNLSIDSSIPVATAKSEVLVETKPELDPASVLKPVSEKETEKGDIKTVDKSEIGTEALPKSSTETSDKQVEKVKNNQDKKVADEKQEVKQLENVANTDMNKNGVASLKTTLTQLTSEAEVLNATASNFAEKKVEDKVRKEAIAVAVASAKAEIASIQKSLETGKITKIELDNQFNRISSAIEAVYTEMKRGGHAGKIEAVLSGEPVVQNNVIIPPKTKTPVQDILNLSDEEIAAIKHEIMNTNPSITDPSMINVVRSGSLNAGSVTVTVNGVETRIASGDTIVGTAGTKNIEQLKYSINWFDFASSTITYSDGTVVGPARKLDQPIIKDITYPNGEVVHGKIKMVRDVTYTDGTKGLTTDERFLNSGITKYVEHIYGDGRAQNDHELYEVLQEGMKFNVKTKVEGYVLTATVTKLAPKNVKTDPNKTESGPVNALRTDGGLRTGKFANNKKADVLLTTQDTLYSYLRTAGIQTINPDGSEMLTAFSPSADQANVGVTFSLSATYHGHNVPVNVIAADAEEANRSEVVQFETDGTNWRQFMELNYNENIRNGTAQKAEAMNEGELSDLSRAGYNPKEWVNTDEKGNPTVYGTKLFGPNRTSKSGKNSLPIALSQDVKTLSLYLNSNGAQAGTFGFMIYDGSDAPESYGEAQHVIGTFNKTKNGQQVTATQPYLGDQPGDPDFRNTTSEKSGAWVLDDLVHTEKYEEVGLKQGDKISNELGDTGTLDKVDDVWVIRKSSTETVALKQGDIVSINKPKEGKNTESLVDIPVRGIFNPTNHSVAIGALPDEGESQLIDGKTGLKEYSLRQATDTEYVLEGIKVNRGINNDDAYVRAWVDFNNNGKFDQYEASEVFHVTQDGTINISFKNTPQLLVTSVDSIGVRIRIGLDEKEILSPTGIASSGEVEDFLTHVVHFPRGSRHRSEGYQGQKQEVNLPTNAIFSANGKTKDSNYKDWAQIENTLAPKFVLTDSTVATTEETGNEANVTLKGTTVYGGKEVILKDANGNVLGTAIKITNPNSGKVEYLTSEYTEYDKDGKKVGVYSLNPEDENRRNTEGPGKIKYTKITFTPALGYVGTANGAVIRAWDENRNSTGWEATATTINQSKNDINLSDKDKITENINKNINGRLSMDTIYIPKVIDIKPVGKDETSVDEQGKNQSVTLNIPDYGTVEVVNNQQIDGAKVSKEHVLVDKTKKYKFADVKIIPGKTYTEDTKVNEETVLRYEDGGTETFKPVDKIPANTEIQQPLRITGKGNVRVSKVLIDKGTVDNVMRVPAGSILDGEAPTPTTQVTVLRNGSEVTVPAGEKLQVGDQLVTPLEIVNNQQVTTWTVTLKKGDVISSSSSSNVKPTLLTETSVDQLIETKGDSITLGGRDYVNHNDVIPKGTKVAGTEIPLSTVTLPKATHVNPLTGEVTTVERRYTKISDEEIVIENEGTYRLIPTISTNDKGETIYENPTVVFTPHPSFVGVGTGVTIRQPDIDYPVTANPDNVTRRYGTDYGSATYIPTVTPNLTATLTRRIHYVYEGDSGTAPKDKTSILTIDGKPVTNEQTLTYTRDYIIMSEDGTTSKDITIAQPTTLTNPITVDRYVKDEQTGVVTKVATTVTEVKAGDIVKSGTKLKAGTVIIGAWKSINPENDKFTSVISPALKGYTAEVQLPVNEYTKKEQNGVQTHVRSTNSTPVGIYTPSIKNGEVNTKDVGTYEPLVSAVSADNRDDFDVYVYYKADKQVARVVYIDMDATNNDKQGVLETHTGSTKEAEAATNAQDTSVIKKEELNGESATRIKYSTAATIAKYEALGYELKRDGFTNDDSGNRIVGGRKFDEESVADSAKAGEKPQNQTFYVFLGHKRDTGAKVEEESVTRTINYKYNTENHPKAAESVTETLNFRREITIDMALAAKEFPEETKVFNAESTKVTRAEKDEAKRVYDQAVSDYESALAKVAEDAATATALANANKAYEIAEKTLADAKKANSAILLPTDATKAQLDAKEQAEATVRAAQTAYDNAVNTRTTARTNYLAANNADLAKAVVTTQQALEVANATVLTAKAEYEAKIKDSTATEAEKTTAFTKLTDALTTAKEKATEATAAKTAFDSAQNTVDTLKDARDAEKTKNDDIQNRAEITLEAKNAARQAYYDQIIAKVKEATKQLAPIEIKLATAQKAIKEAEAVLADTTASQEAKATAQQTINEARAAETMAQDELTSLTAIKNKISTVNFGEWKALGSTATNLPTNEQLSDAEKLSDNAFNKVTSPTIVGYLADKVAIDRTDAIDPLAADYSVDVFYDKGEQRATVKFVEVDPTNTDTIITPGVAADLVEVGKTGGNFVTLTTAAVEAEIQKLQDKGYTLVSNGFANPGEGVSNTTFDNDSKKDQEFVVKLKAKVVEIPPFDPTKPESNENLKPTPGVTPVDPQNPSGPKWTEDLIKAVKVQEEVTRTIKYVYEDGTEVPAEKLTTVADKKVKTLTFTRSGKINVVTGEITYGDWSANQTFEAVTSPTIENYTAVVAGVTPTTPDVPTKTVTATDKDFEEVVVYKKVKPVTITPNTDVPNPEDPNTPVDPNNPIQPDKPIDPNDPEGPKWTKDLIDKLRDTRQEKVTRTITYKYSDVTTDLKDDDAAKAGTDVKENVTVTNTVTFKRAVTIDPITKEFTYGDWVADNNDTTLEGKVELPKVDGYIATGDVESSKKDVTDVKATDKDITEKVVYKALGKYVPVVPEGFTPPTIENPQYPNSEDPSKPGTPTTKIPEIPGTTPVGPDGKPLEKDPTGGYKVPPVPKNPTENTTITYVKDGSQVAVTHFIEVNSATDKTEKGVVAQSIVDTGDTGKVFTKGQSVTDTINVLKAKGYTVVENGYPENGTFDADATTNQEYKVLVTVNQIPVTPETEIPDPNTPEDPTKPIQPGKPIDPQNPNGPKWTPELIKELEDGRKEEVKRTIKYIYSDGTAVEDSNLTSVADKKEKTLTFKRSATINPVTGKITFGDWSAAQTFEEVTSPAIDNAIVDRATVPEKEVTATADDITETVVYSKLGSYIPVVPDGVIVPPGTDTTAKVYPKNPNDPTKPGTPTTTIPEIPGTTPVGPNGKPLEKDPNGGYKVPPVPTDPTQNTTITYVKDGSQVAVVHFVDEKGRAVYESVVETGDTGNTISKTKVDIVKAALEAKGYTVVEPTDALYTADKEGFYKEETRTFDAVSDKDTGVAGEKVPSQQYYVIVKAEERPVDPTNPNTPTPPAKPTDKIPEDPKGRTYGDLGLVETVTRTINYVKNDGTKAADPVKETLTFTRKAKINAVTGEVTYLAADGVTPVASKDDAPWTAVNGTEFKAVKSPTGAEKPELANYIPTKAEVEAKTGVIATDEDIVETVVYNPTTEKVDPKDPNYDPEKPLNPTNPNGPKYKDLKLKEEVARTITYTYANDVEDTTKRGTVAAPEFKTTVEFTRTATINKATGEVTYSGWTAKDNDTTLEKDTKDLPLIPGYVATGDLDKIKEDVTNVNETDKDIENKVVYKDLGKYVPVVPEGTTPPTITEPKYPNHPTDPTKPGEPTTRIPNVPGLTPLDPSTGKPLEPVTPGKPDDGYKPPVPQVPSENTNIVYVADGSQVAIVHFVDESGKAVHTSLVEAGNAGAKFTKAGEVTKVIDELKAEGYVVVPNKANQKDYPAEAERVFDSVDDKGDKGVSQVYYVTVAKPIPVTPTNPKNPKEDPQNPKPGDPIDPKNPNGPKWTKEALDKLNNIKSVTRTITYIKDGTEEEVSPTEAPKVTDKVSFTRTAIVNPKDGSVVGYDTNGDGKADVPATDITSGWTAVNNDTTFDAVKSPVVKGYIVKPNQDTQGDLVEADGSKVVETTELTVNSANQDLKVRYVSVGKLVPKVPAGETPPTPVTPTPYENVPGEPGKVVPPSPTKPTDPQDPNSPRVPVIPHVPGYTPKIPKDPTKPVDPNTNPLLPLEPVTPGKPDDGYKVPPVPKDPTKDLEINYVKDEQKAVTKFVDLSGNPIPDVNNIEETGKSGEPLTKANEVTTEIAKLIAKGYVLVSNNYGKDNNGNFDKDSTKDQEYTVVVKPMIVPVNPQPEQPIDPENPTGPKWDENLIKQLDTKREVKRTITYVDESGNTVSKQVDDKVIFTRDAKINTVTREITYGEWKASNNDITFDKVTSPSLKGYVLKDASQKEVAATTGLTPDSKDENIVVVYTKLGSWVPKVPEGETPIDPIPYPNDPTDPAKPGTEKPRIPEIPGHTPSVPTDPTKPVSPTNPLKPLDPSPQGGYEVPNVPKDPSKDTPIEYVKDGQRAITNFVDKDGKVVAPSITDSGKSNTSFTKDKDVAETVAKLIAKGYDVVSNDYPTNGKFDNDDKVDQYFNVVVTPHVEPVKPFDPENPQDPNRPQPNQPIDPNNPEGPKWTEELIDKLETTKHVNRTIIYINENGDTVAKKVTDKVTFTREAKVNTVTKEITYGGWTAVDNDTMFVAVTSPVVKGYVLKDATQKVVAATTGLTVDSKDEYITVVYTKLGSWVPKVPEGVTPVPPIPYPMDPNDPTKPGTPTQTVPKVPGTTPQVPTDPTKPVGPNNPLVPLKPVNPQNPDEGYKVPPVPTNPGIDTPIVYVKDGQKAIVNFVDEKENTVAATIIETGKSGESFTKGASVTETIAELVAKGYEVVSNDYPTNGKFDNDDKVDQVYTVKVKPVTKPIVTPEPGEPINPDNPDGPKFDDKEIVTEKVVTRTVKYVDEKGTVIYTTHKEKLKFTRTATINAVTKEVAYGDWVAVNGDNTLDAVTSPVIKGYVLKAGQPKVVDARTGLDGDSSSDEFTIVYAKLGSWVPKVPEGVTPIEPTPYPNDPTDPTKPGTEKPRVPYVPGYTPKDPNGNPLKPVDPNDPTKGYEVPDVPADPTENTPIYYVTDKQKAYTYFKDNEGNDVSPRVEDEGDSGTNFTKDKEVTDKINKLVQRGYVVTSNDYPSADTDRVFDNDKDKDQIFNVKVTPLIVPTDPNSPDKPQVPTDPTKPVGPNNPLKPVTPSTPEPGKPVFPEDPNSPVWPETVKDLVTEATATRTITYVDQNGKPVAATHTETIKFKRSAKVNLVTGEIIYGDWTVVGDDTILDGNQLPKVDGYIARRGDIDASQEDIKATAGMNITQTVVYDKLGSWVPKVPEGATPVPPITYPNDPTDPTKPGTDKPIVPHVPGFIPVDPNGNPLKPVDPNDPTKGYEVPDVPADPTQDTPIKYVPVIPEKPTPTPVVPVQPEGPNEQSESNTPKYADGQNELPNTGTKDHADLATLGLLGALSGFGLVARKKREDEK